MTRRAIVVVAIAFLSSACAVQPGTEGRPLTPVTTLAPGPPTPSPTTSETPEPQPSPSREPRPPREPETTLLLGQRGPDVRWMQRRLTDLTFDPGPIDGVFGQMTLDAVLAFEKLHALTRDGAMQPKDLRSLARASRPAAPARPVTTFVDVDIGRQVLLEVVDGRVVQTLAVSTGNEAIYESASGPAVAHTPRGAFTIQRKIEGWRVGPLGPMFYPSYFYGGYAIHGSSSVPAYPASHGCVRIPIHSTIGFFERNPVGTPVFVHE